MQTPMRRVLPLALGVLASAVALAPPDAVAAPCAGFSDLDTSSPFCVHVEWIKNRGVTQGCTLTTYCPNDLVTRLSMAAFLRRLGDAMTPVDLTPVVGGPTAGVTPATNPVLCATPDYLVSSFPRRAYVNTAAILSSPSGNIDVRAHVVYSTDAGTSWTFVPSSDQYATLYVGATPVNHVTVAPFGALDLNVAQSVRFGVQLEQFLGSGTVTVSCQNRVQLVSRTGGSSPLDAQPLAVDRSSAGTLPVR